MRKILFRAKRLDNGKWVEGSLKQTGGICEIHTFDAEAYAKETDKNGWDIFDYTNSVTVEPETVSQFTGLTDKNGNKIWENETRNIYSWGRNGDLIGVATIVWDTEEMGWCIEPSLGIEDRYDLRRAIENSEIHNPEILQK